MNIKSSQTFIFQLQDVENYVRPKIMKVIVHHKDRKFSNFKIIEPEFAVSKVGYEAFELRQ